MKPTIRFKLLREGARLPSRATSTSGAFDIFAPEPGILRPGTRRKIPTGLSHEIPDLEEIQSDLFCLHGLLISRSGLAMNQGIRLFWDGLIDHDYRGEIHVPLENTEHTTFTWKAGERLCQIAYVPMFMGCVEESTELTPTARGTGGFGSTGK